MPTWYIIGRMNLKQLRTFVRVGELGSLSMRGELTVVTVAAREPESQAKGRRLLAN
jgi:hypothetical protein